MKRESGFTLIEILIAMTIMAFLTVMVSQSMRRSADFKSKVQKNIDQRSAINSAMRIIERDINLAFHYQDVHTEVMKEIEKKKKALRAGGQGNQGNQAGNQGGGLGGNPGTPGNPGNRGNQGNQGNLNPNAPIYRNFKIREVPNYTAFKGTKNAIHFTNINNITVQPGEKVSDQQEVGYFVKSCKSLANPDVTSQCLWRRTSPYLDDKVDEGGSEVVLIEGVKKFELRYFGKEKEDWVETWDSTPEGGDEVIRNKFPSAVEVTLTVEQNKREISAIRVVALRFPNNPEDQNTQGQPQQTPLDGGGPSEVDYSGD